MYNRAEIVPQHFLTILIAQFIGAMLVQYIPNIFSLAKHCTIRVESRSKKLSKK